MSSDDKAVIRYVCKRTVVSTKPVSPGKYYPLSVLDRLMEKNRVRMVWYYPPISAIGEKIKIGEISTKLRESLSELLSEFPMMTGRLKKDDQGRWTVKCNDAGVRLVDARVKGSVEDWLSCVDRDRELMLVHWEEMYHKPYFWSPFYVQVSEFEEGGFAIGLSCIHLLSDPTSTTVFIDSWAQSTFFGKSLASHFDPLPHRTQDNCDRITPYASLTEQYKHRIERSLSVVPTGDPNYTTVSFLFSSDKVRACIAKARTSGPQENSSWAFEALCGLFWVCISRAKGVINGLVDMSVCLDAREVLGLDKRFFGNCMVYYRVQTEGLRGDDVEEAANGVAQAMGGIDRESVMDLIEWLEKGEDDHDHDMDRSQPFIVNGCELVCAALETVNPYSAVFGDGVKPIRVSCYVEPVMGIGQVLVLPGPPREGPLSKVVMVTLPRNDVAKLCEDTHLLSFSPVLLMGFN